MKKRIFCMIMCTVFAATALTGCGKSGTAEPVEVVTSSVEEEPVEEEPEEEPEAEAMAAEPVEAEPEFGEELPEGKMRSYLTGEVVDEAFGMKRPFAVMINNISDAIPQSGISGAEVMYEAYVEGNITRLMAVFQDPAPYAKLGPVRSSRHYFIDYADDFDANYVHFGWSYAAEHKIGQEERITINGQFYDGSWGFFRTDDRVAPHNAYVDGKELEGIAKDAGMNVKYDERTIPTLQFNLEDTEPEGEDAPVIRLGYLYNMPWFDYNAAEKVYYRNQYGAPHIDVENNEQLKFKNVIVLYQEMSQFNNDEKLKEMDRFGSGTGLYFSDGKMQEITWEKPAVFVHNTFRDKDGNVLKINPGKTMIQIAPPELDISWKAGEEFVSDTPTEEATDTED